MADQDAYAHPRLVFFHLFFKAVALLFYMFGWITTAGFIVHFVICVLFIAFDFWVVKNVSGRILVGLRWWNETDENGENIWRFESLEKSELERLSKPDSWLFWWTLYLVPAVWVLLGVISIIRFTFETWNYLLIVAVAVALGGSNIYGFTKCRSDAKKQIQQFATQTMASTVASTLQTAFAV
eukprot:TRINITY_DN26747_c0_g1_i1.p1 TRINITY_DN26747_c0_g1~~TRINITY_DN26747_c0_g1_i1.p1  ORF type:complete len:182 (-),score=32.09 TRINITY_DN26747_c0_g1_i1:446-991(-)